MKLLTRRRGRAGLGTWFVGVVRVSWGPAGHSGESACQEEGTGVRREP